MGSEDYFKRAATLEQNGAVITDLKHAWRVNGVFDIWKNEAIVFELPLNKYHRFVSRRESFDFVEANIKSHEPRDAFKKTKKGRMTYQEFKHQSRGVIVEIEYAYWERDMELVSEDALYFIHSGGGHIKIGRSKDPFKRITELSTGSPLKTKLLLVIPNRGCMEKRLHKWFEDQRCNGEWFVMNDRMVRFIDYLTRKLADTPMEELVAVAQAAKIPRPSPTPKKAFLSKGGKIMPFGKHKGLTLDAIPLEYAVWGAENLSNGDIKEYFKQRVAAACNLELQSI